MVLQRQLDNLSPDPEIVGFLTRAARRGAALFMAGALFAGGTAATGAVESIGEDAKDSLLQHIADIFENADEVEQILEDTPPTDQETERHAAYDGFTHFYNHHRSHGALGWATPIETLTRLTRDNLPPQHT
jgi:hypothetical protein